MELKSILLPWWSKCTKWNNVVVYKRYWFSDFESHLTWNMILYTPKEILKICKHFLNIKGVNTGDCLIANFVLWRTARSVTGWGTKDKWTILLKNGINISNQIWTFSWEIHLSFNIDLTQSNVKNKFHISYHKFIFVCVVL